MPIERRRRWIVLALLVLLSIGLGEVGAEDAPEDPAAKIAELRKQMDQAGRSGKLAAALALARKILVVQASSLGADHVDVAITLDIIGGVERMQGKLEPSYKAHERARAIFAKQQGKHADMRLINLQQLVRVLHTMGRFLEASKHGQAAVDLAVKLHGADDTHMLPDVLDLAAPPFFELGAYAKARVWTERSLELREQSVGKVHPMLCATLLSLAALNQAQGAEGAARPLFERALSIFEKTLGPKHPASAQPLLGLAEWHLRQGSPAEARPLSERALTMLEGQFGPNHPHVGRAVDQLGRVHFTAGDVDAALPLFERGLKIREVALGGTHVEVARSLNNLAMAWKEKGEFTKALPHSERALGIEEAALGEHHM